MQEAKWTTLQRCIRASSKTKNKNKLNPYTHCSPFYVICFFSVVDRIYSDVQWSWLCIEWCRRMLDDAVHVTGAVSGSCIRSVCRRVIKTLHLDRTSTLLVWAYVVQTYLLAVFCSSAIETCMGRETCSLSCPAATNKFSYLCSPCIPVHTLNTKIICFTKLIHLWFLCQSRQSIA